MPSGVRTCCTQRGQGSCAADPRVQPGSVARYLEKTAVVPLDSEYDAGMIFKLGTLQGAQPSWPDVHDTACLQLGRSVSGLRGWLASFGDTQPMSVACQVRSLSRRCLRQKRVCTESPWAHVMLGLRARIAGSCHDVMLQEYIPESTLADNRRESSGVPANHQHEPLGTHDSPGALQCCPAHRHIHNCSSQTYPRSTPCRVP